MTVRQRESAKTNSPNSKEKPKENGNEKPAGMWNLFWFIYVLLNSRVSWLQKFLSHGKIYFFKLISIRISNGDVFRDLELSVVWSQGYALDTYIENCEKLE